MLVYHMCNYLDKSAILKSSYKQDKKNLIKLKKYYIFRFAKHYKVLRIFFLF